MFHKQKNMRTITNSIKFIKLNLFFYIGRANVKIKVLLYIAVNTPPTVAVLTSLSSRSAFFFIVFFCVCCWLNPLTCYTLMYLYYTIRHNTRLLDCPQKPLDVKEG